MGDLSDDARRHMEEARASLGKGLDARIPCRLCTKENLRCIVVGDMRVFGCRRCDFFDLWPIVTPE